MPAIRLKRTSKLTAQEPAVASGGSGPVPAPMPSCGRPDARRGDRVTAGDRDQVVLHVEAETLQADAEAPASHVSAETSSYAARSVGRGCPDAVGRPVAATSAARIAGHAALEDGDGLRVSADTSRRLACDAAAVVMQHAPDGAILDVGRKTRTILRRSGGRSLRGTRVNMTTRR